MRKKLPGLLCAAIMGITLAAGLVPFRAPRNAVTWLGHQDGVRFGRYATVFSPGGFPAPTASSSIEMWVQPARTSGSSTFLSFSTPQNPLQLGVQQYYSALIVKREIRSDPPRNAVIGIDGVFLKVQPVFLTITSGPQQTAIYVNGVLSGKFPQFSLDDDFTGQLVLGTSPVN